MKIVYGVLWYVYVFEHGILAAIYCSSPADYYTLCWLTVRTVSTKRTMSSTCWCLWFLWCASWDSHSYCTKPSLKATNQRMGMAAQQVPQIHENCCFLFLLYPTKELVFPLALGTHWHHPISYLCIQFELILLSRSELFENNQRVLLTLWILKDPLFC